MSSTETIEERDSLSYGIPPNITEDTKISDMVDLLHIDVEPDTIVSHGTEDSPCSRNVLRKQRNWEKTLAAKKNKRKEEKLRRKLNRAEQPGPDGDGSQLSKRVVKAITKERLTEARVAGPKLCVDLSMTDCMSHKEISRLACQIRRLYGSNRKAARPFHLLLTDMRADSLLYRECVRMNDGFLSYVMDITEENCLDLFPQDSVIYLTPDAEQALETVDTEKVYILGGLVDESIQKKLSYLKARERNVSTARLPIDEYMVKKSNPKNFHSKILAINQVFDILLAFCDTGSWMQALQVGVPPGKGYTVALDSASETQR
ncbi:hypothetical protein MATL_G00196730 [Megalops atlanticus]|uniref:tRNA methyltransferase 10 homolog B n=1 Tax=Megalops atlanticus TaxID=7932 RepID=A0A9D3T5S2_MEGAT|nr:hypothetical protein MATL_G00196730 [Megalops atlanticus]